MRVSGIRISVGISWFVILFLYIIFFTPALHRELGGSSSTAYIVTVLTALGFFASLIVHELGHAITARRNGLEVVGIELWALGGITRTAGTADTPGAQLRVAAAGPLGTIAVVGLCALGGVLLAPQQQFFAVTVAAGVHTTPLGVCLKIVAMLNVIVLAINLVPAFPLDGGQIAQAIVWKATGDRNLATRVTGRMGQAFALAAGAAGLYLVAQAHSELGLYPMLIAWLVYQGASAAVAQGSLGQRIQRLTVADVMDRQPVAIQAQETLLDAQERYFARYQAPWFAVIGPDRHFLGVLTQARIDQELRQGRPALRAQEALEGDMQERIAESQPLESLLRCEALARLGGMVVLDAEGTLRGVVTLAQVRQALRPAS